ncbi:recombinase family protein [Erysipelothrix anatis]|uniref:recombinase family protein n=1 Tax=Erysipelothrix anatis TaxID=2683713 RepID=UPI0013588522|nr:recombinase family protein [Erysipelothrix anatis]
MHIKKDTSELLISILSAFAQEESASKSTDIKWGIKQKMKEGTYIVKAIYGYRSVDQQIVINQNEADVVCLIYELYVNNNSYGTIKAELEKRDLLSPTGGNTWSTKTIERILSNEKYLGSVTYPKSFSKDYLNNQRVINKGEVTQYTVYDNHDAIISEDQFNQVQVWKQKRANYEINNKGEKVRKKTKVSKDEIVNTIRCEHCGCSYRRRKERGKIVYRCSNRMENGRQACPLSKTIKT